MMSNAAKNFDNLATSLNVLHYFDSSLKLFSSLYLAKFLDNSAKTVRIYLLSSCLFLSKIYTIVS